MTKGSKSSQASFRRRFFSYDGGKLSFLEWGDSQGATNKKPLLHFTHATGFNGQSANQLLTPLAKDFHVRAWDARGHGRTSLPTNPKALRNWYGYRDDLIAFLEPWHAQTRQKVWLMGHSMGATVNLLAAAKRPDLVAGIFLLDPVLFPSWFGRLARVARLFIKKARGMDLARLAEKRRAHWASREKLFTVYKDRGAFYGWPDSALRDYIDGGTGNDDSGGVYLSCAPAWEAATFRAQNNNSFKSLKALSVPFALLIAEHNSPTSPWGRRLAVNNAFLQSLTVLSERNHFFPFLYPDLVHDAFRDFIKSCDR